MVGMLSFNCRWVSLWLQFVQVSCDLFLYVHRHVLSSKKCFIVCDQLVWFLTGMLGLDFVVNCGIHGHKFGSVSYNVSIGRDCCNFHLCTLWFLVLATSMYWNLRRWFLVRFRHGQLSISLTTKFHFCTRICGLLLTFIGIQITPDAFGRWQIQVFYWLPSIIISFEDRN